MIQDLSLFKFQCIEIVNFFPCLNFTDYNTRLMPPKYAITPEKRKQSASLTLKSHFSISCVTSHLYSINKFYSRITIERSIMKK